MATVKVYSVDGVKEVPCFASVEDVPFLTGFEDGTELLPDFIADEEEL